MLRMLLRFPKGIFDGAHQVPSPKLPILSQTRFIQERRMEKGADARLKDMWPC